MTTLHLTIKRQWFDLIAARIKKHEYRSMKPYWANRLEGKQFDAVHFRNGYSANAPTILVELKGIGVGLGQPDWGAPSTLVYILYLGEILQMTPAVSRPQGRIEWLS